MEFDSLIICNAQLRIMLRAEHVGREVASGHPQARAVIPNNRKRLVGLMNCLRNDVLAGDLVAAATKRTRPAIWMAEIHCGGSIVRLGIDLQRLTVVRHPHEVLHSPHHSELRDSMPTRVAGTVERRGCLLSC